MATYPLTGQANANSIIKGSCKIEISTDSGVSWTNLGIARGVNFQENAAITKIQADNAPDPITYLSEHKVTLSFNSLELYLPNLNIIRGAIDLLTVTSAVSSTKTDSYTATQWAYNQNILLVSQGDSTTLPTINAVKTWKTGTTVALTTSGLDYVRTLNANNKVGITVLSTDFGGDALDTQTLRISYTYGNILTRKLTSGGKSSISPRWFKLTNKEIIGGAAKYRYITIYSGTIAEGLNLAFKSANENDPVLEIPIKIEAVLDTTRSEGDQLFAIEDQGATA